MNIPFDNRYGHWELTEEVQSKIVCAEDEQSAELIFLDYISDCDSPYELNGFVWQDYYESIELDLTELVLDFVAMNKERWDPDEVSCFFLEIADDHSTYGGSAYWLKQIELGDMLSLPYAGEKVEYLFWWCGCSWIFDLINHYQWNYHFTKLLDEAAEGDENHPYYVAARLIERGKLDISPDECEVCQSLVHAFKQVEREDYYGAIPILLSFQESYPAVLSQRVIKLLASSYLEAGWRGQALYWATKLGDFPDKWLDAYMLSEEILAPEKDLLARVREDLIGTFYYLDPESLDILVNAEFMFRYHGRMLPEYGPLISAYARVIETHLQNRILPQVEDAIKKFGKEDQKGQKYASYKTRRGKKAKLYADSSKKGLTLGTWGSLFFSDDYMLHRKGRGDGSFYDCLHKKFGVTVRYKDFVGFGEKLIELTDYRNAASHEIIKDWDQVSQVRNIVIEENNLSMLRTTNKSYL